MTCSRPPLSCAQHSLLLPGRILQTGRDYVELLALAYAMAPPCSPDERLLVGLLAVAKRRYSVGGMAGAACVTHAQPYVIQLPELTDAQHQADLAELAEACEE